VFAEDQFGEVERESVGIIQGKGVGAAEYLFIFLLQLLHLLIEQTDAGVECALERFLLLFDDVLDERLLRNEFGISISHRLDENGKELIHERFMLSEEGITVTDGTAENTTDHITGLGVRRQLTVGDGEGDGTDMVGDDAHGNILLGIFAIDAARHLSDDLDDRLEDVGVVVGGLALQSHAEAFETHSGVDHLGRQRLKRTVGLAVVLHEDEVPDLDHLGIILIDQFGSGHLLAIFFAAEVDMDLRAGSARTRVAHFPEVIMFVAIDDMIFRKIFLPFAGSFVVAVETFSRTTLEDRCIEMVGVELQGGDEIFPGKADGLFLEIVTERPVAEHLEHRVVIGVVADLFQIVVFAAYAKTLL
jgi:hypothetical protein